MLILSEVIKTHRWQCLPAQNLIYGQHCPAVPAIPSLTLSGEGNNWLFVQNHHTVTIGTAVN